MELVTVDQMKRNTVNDVFAQKKEYFIIALTGKVGSNCSDVANRIGADADDLLPSPPQPGMHGLTSDEDREIRLIRRFYNDNRPDSFQVIHVRDVILTYLLEEKNSWERNEDIANSWDECNKAANQASGLVIDSADKAREYVEAIKSFSYPSESMGDSSISLEELQKFITTWLPTYGEELKKKLAKKYTVLFQRFGNELRFFGSLNTEKWSGVWETWYQEKSSRSSSEHPIYCIAARINIFIKILRRDSSAKNKKNPLPIVIDSIKNIYESNYLKDRYSAYYLVSISCDENERIQRLIRDTEKGYTSEMVEWIDYNERPSQSSKKIHQFLEIVRRNLKDIESTIDIRPFQEHIDHLMSKNDCCGEVLESLKQCICDSKTWKDTVTTIRDTMKTKEHDKEFLSMGITRSLQKYYWEILDDVLRVFVYLNGLYPFYVQDVESCIQNADIFLADTEKGVYKPKLNYQLMRYVSLILHPGIVTPTPIERCMQIAYAAKANSGCISRQVGAVTTDASYNILSLGWNDVPCGQTSCIYRNLVDLSRQIDKPAYSDYEYDEMDEFQRYISKYHFSKDLISERLHGLPASFCFKDIHYRITGDKNPMDARSMHGEEKALSNCDQQRVRGGFLFTTSSPCEMCAKNAKNHQIKKIYYIEPYPGISQKHCCNSGVEDNRAQYVLYEGAIGRAYTQLYTPILPYKDELYLRGFPESFDKSKKGAEKTAQPAETKNTPKAKHIRKTM
ncbi:MAG: hypothetical protein IKC28_01675 [Clostridia bacterium]|nr:hypothetical protein [Clostridia bacterium]